VKINRLDIIYDVEIIFVLVGFIINDF